MELFYLEFKDHIKIEYSVVYVCVRSVLGSWRTRRGLHTKNEMYQIKFALYQHFEWQLLKALQTMDG